MTARGSRLPIVVRADVAAALSQGHPVVALESTIVSHGTISVSPVGAQPSVIR